MLKSIACCWVGIAILGGCESSNEPQVTGLVSRDFTESFAVPTDRDTVLVLLGTTEYRGLDQPADVFLNAQPSADGSLGFEIRIVGLTLGPNPGAIVDHQWAADTLKVWCGLDEAVTWDAGEKSDGADPWSPPYLIPKRVDITAPEGVFVRYLGNWFE